MTTQDSDLFSIAESLESENDPIQYQKFADYYQDDMADGTIIQYMRYLSKLDFDPTVNNPEPRTVDIENFQLSDFKVWATKKAGNIDGDNDRFRYFTYLALKNYLEAVGETGKISELPPSKQMTKPSSNSPKTRYSEEQVRKLLNAISKDNQQLRLATIHMFYAGMRSFEVLHIKPSWYDFSGSEAIEIEIPSEYAKGKKNSKEPEYCFLPPRFEQEIKDFVKEQYDWDEGYESLLHELSEGGYEHMFDFIDGSDKDFKALARERYYLNKELQEVAEKSGINRAEDISAHRLRKSFVHHIYEGEDGLNLSRTSRLARHQNTDLTDKHYLNIEKQESKEDYQSVMG